MKYLQLFENWLNEAETGKSEAKPFDPSKPYMALVVDITKDAIKEGTEATKEIVKEAISDGKEIAVAAMEEGKEAVVDAIKGE